MSSRLNWDDYFGILCQLISKRSDDEETNTGSIIVDKNNRIISTGYNGTPKGTNFPKKRPEKYPYMVHGEINAIIFAKQNLEGCKIYVLGMMPCDSCARAIAQAGITEVIVVNEITRNAGKDWNFSASEAIFNQCKINLRKIKTKYNIELVENK